MLCAITKLQLLWFLPSKWVVLKVILIIYIGRTLLQGNHLPIRLGLLHYTDCKRWARKRGNRMEKHLHFTRVQLGPLETDFPDLAFGFLESPWSQPSKAQRTFSLLVDTTTAVSSSCSLTLGPKLNNWDAMLKKGGVFGTYCIYEEWISSSNPDRSP